MTIPNILSIFRILLIPLFVFSFFWGGDTGHLYAAFILLISGATDFLDGVIARKFHQISELGKILDPFADKLTQVAVGLCLCIKYSSMWLIVMMVLIIVKEFLMMCAAIILIRKNLKVRGSRWFGKVATFMFYAAVMAFTLFPVLEGLPMDIISITITMTMTYALVRYIFEFFSMINRPTAADQRIQENPGA